MQPGSGFQCRKDECRIGLSEGSHTWIINKLNKQSKKEYSCCSFCFWKSPVWPSVSQPKRWPWKYAGNVVGCKRSTESSQLQQGAAQWARSWGAQRSNHEANTTLVALVWGCCFPAERCSQGKQLLSGCNLCESSSSIPASTGMDKKQVGWIF